MFLVSGAEPLEGVVLITQIGIELRNSKRGNICTLGFALLE
jgi:hypothetical protein